MGKKASHLIKIWFFDNFPKRYTKEMIYAAVCERFDFLKDKLENVIVETLLEEKVETTKEC